MSIKTKIFGKINIVYVLTSIISIILIRLSFYSNLGPMWQTIFVSIGCSGITAAVMSVFLDIRNEKKDKRKKEEFRKMFLYGLYHELQHLFERVLWFDRVFDKLELDKEIDFYMTTSFVREAYFCDCYEATSLEKCTDEISRVIEKYNNDEWKELNDHSKKVQKMFRIIGEASTSVIYEQDVIKRNQMFLMTNEIFTMNELQMIYTHINRFVDLLRTPKTNYSTALHFLYHGYLELHKLGMFKQEMFICWQPPKNITDMVIEERQKEEIIHEQKISLNDKNIVKKRKNKNKKRNK